MQRRSKNATVTTRVRMMMQLTELMAFVELKKLAVVMVLLDLVLKFQVVEMKKRVEMKQPL